MLAEVNNILNSTAEAIDQSDELNDVLAGVDDTLLSVVCEQGNEPMNGLKSLLNPTVDLFSSLLDIGVNATDLMHCKHIHKIWVDIAHDAVCTNTPTALTWIFSTMTTIYICGFFTVLLRSALLPAVYIDEESYKLKPSKTLKSEEEYSDNGSDLLQGPGEHAGIEPLPPPVVPTNEPEVV